MSGEFVRILSFEDYLAANWLVFRRRWLWRGVLRFLLIVWPIYFLIGEVAGGFDNILAPHRIFNTGLIGFCGAAAVLAALMLIWCWQLPRKARKLYAQMHLDGMETRYHYDGTHFDSVNPRGSLHVAWADVVRWIEDDRILMLFVTDGQFVALPKHQFAKATLLALREARSVHV